MPEQGDLPHLSIQLTAEPKRLTHSTELGRGEDLEMGKAYPCYSKTLWLMALAACDCVQIPALASSPVPLLEVGTSFFLTRDVLRNIL